MTILMTILTYMRGLANILNNRDKWFFILQSLIKNSTFIVTPSVRGILYRFFLKQCGKNFKVCDNVVIKYPSEISVGNNICFNQNSYIVGKGGLAIGDNVMTGAGVKMVTTSHSMDIENDMMYQAIVAKPITIENNVWIGFDVVIMSGITIGTGSVIGASSVVTKNIPAYSVAVGIPSKIIKKRK
jgi:maltose O-acetyltransferase